MVARPHRRDDRAVSETTGVVILVGFTVLVTASVGISVLVIDSGDTGTASANFTFEYRSQDALLVVTHERGDALPAGDIHIEGPDASATWAEVARVPGNQTIEPGGLPIQLSEASAWGSPVTQGQAIEIYYVPDEGNRTFLDAWEG